jgi:glucose dehydrogenase
LLLPSGCKKEGGERAGTAKASQGAKLEQLPADPAALQNDDGQWVMPAKNYAATRFSGLKEINAGNVKSLKVAWTFANGVPRGQEAAPLVVGSTLYVVTPFPNRLFALDLSQPGAPRTRTGRSSTTRSTTTPSRWTRRRAARCGRRCSATSTRARPSPWRPWW